MFENIIEKMKNKPETIQQGARSDQLVPSLEVVDSRRVLFLSYQGKKYPCMERAWTSWADKVLVPSDDMIDTELTDEYTGNRKRWSSATVRRFLDATPIEVANKAIVSWWERCPPTDWNIVRYETGAIRYVGSVRYRLYKNIDFLEDLSSANLSGFKIVMDRNNEDSLCIRLAKKKALNIPSLGDNIFPGFHILNSENGSSSILIKYFIYDLICTNGLIAIKKTKNLIEQKHVNFDVLEFRENIRQVADKLDGLNQISASMISGLCGKALNQKEVQQVMKFYKSRFGSSGKFVEKVLERIGKASDVRAWSVISAITEEAQQYSFDTRMIHEENAGLLADDLLNMERWKSDG